MSLLSGIVAMNAVALTYEELQPDLSMPDLKFNFMKAIDMAKGLKLLSEPSLL
tara:strand:- start:253 stop:411 length:159 start_codon:yes stop_codon:yes gene_type:complete